MVYRRDLISHFSWLAGSWCFDEVLDEAVVAIAMSARGLDHALVEAGAAWMTVGGVVERLELEEFVERERSSLGSYFQAPPRHARFRSVARLVPESPPASSAAVRKSMQGNRSEGTKPEVALGSALHRRGLRYRKHARPEPSLRCKADFVFRRARVAVFVDGCFWHSCPEHGSSPKDPTGYWGTKLRRNVERDRANDMALRDAGWKVLRFWEHEDPEAVAPTVEALVRACLEGAGQQGAASP